MRDKKVKTFILIFFSLVIIMPRPNKVQDAMNLDIAYNLEAFEKEKYSWENFYKEIFNAPVYLLNWDGGGANLFSVWVLQMNHFLMGIGWKDGALNTVADEFCWGGDLNKFREFTALSDADYVLRVEPGEDDIYHLTLSLYYDRNRKEYFGEIYGLGTSPTVMQNEITYGLSTANPPASFDVTLYGLDHPNENIRTAYNCWKYLGKYFSNVDIRKEGVGIAIPETPVSDNTESEYYAGLAPNLEFKRTQGFTLGFDSGHSFYIPLGYAIDNDSTMILHKRFPEIQNQFMLIRRIHGTLLEGLVPSALGFGVTLITGSKGVGAFTTRVIEETAKDRFAYLFPYIYSAAWSTYVHYDYPDYTWIDRVGEPGGLLTRANMYYMIYPGGFMFVRNHLNDSSDNYFYKNINKTYPRDYIWIREQLDEIFVMLEVHPEWNEQLKNVEKSTPMGYDPMGGQIYIPLVIPSGEGRAPFGFNPEANSLQQYLRDRFQENVSILQEDIGEYGDDFVEQSSGRVYSVDYGRYFYRDDPDDVWFFKNLKY